MAKASFASNGYYVSSKFYGATVKKKTPTVQMIIIDEIPPLMTGQLAEALDSMHKVPSFEIFRADGTKSPTLKKSFLVKHHIGIKDIVNGELQLEDETLWHLVCEFDIQHLHPTENNPYCIVSYQVHTYGNFAIARICKDKDTKFLTIEEVSCLEPLNPTQI